jgi:hypothetical protein
MKLILFVPGKKYHHYNGNPHRKSIMKEMQNLGLPRPTRKNQPESASKQVVGKFKAMFHF